MDRVEYQNLSHHPAQSWCSCQWDKIICSGSWAWRIQYRQCQGRPLMSWTVPLLLNTGNAMEERCSFGIHISNISRNTNSFIHDSFGLHSWKVSGNTSSFIKKAPEFWKMLRHFKTVRVCERILFPPLPLPPAPLFENKPQNGAPKQHLKILSPCEKPSEVRTLIRD